MIPPTICQKTRLLNCTQSAVSMLVDTNGSEKRTLVRMQKFIELVEGQNENRKSVFIVHSEMFRY